MMTDPLPPIQTILSRDCGIEVEVGFYDTSGADDLAEPQLLTRRLEWTTEMTAEQKLDAWKRLTGELNVVMAVALGRMGQQSMGEREGAG